MTKYIFITVCGILYLLWNIVAFSMMGIDKRKAVRNQRRISERALLLSAFFFGGIGSLTGMFVFRHKTRHLKFRILLPLFTLLNISILFLLYYYFG